MTQKEFYRSMPWIRARQAYIDERIMIDGGMCEKCGERLGKIVHHKIWLNDINCNDPDIALNPKNFEYECQICHNKETDPSKQTTSNSRIRYLSDGTVVNNGNY